MGCGPVSFSSVGCETKYGCNMVLHRERKSHHRERKSHHHDWMSLDVAIPANYTTKNKKTAPSTSFTKNIHQMKKNSKTKKMNREIRVHQFSLNIIHCHLITVHSCSDIKKPARFLFQSDTGALF